MWLHWGQGSWAIISVLKNIYSFHLTSVPMEKKTLGPEMFSFTSPSLLINFVRHEVYRRCVHTKWVWTSFNFFLTRIKVLWIQRFSLPSPVLGLSFFLGLFFPFMHSVLPSDVDIAASSSLLFLVFSLCGLLWNIKHNRLLILSPATCLRCVVFDWTAHLFEKGAHVTQAGLEPTM